ncbi:MAG: HAMP domain-containing protein, partial [Desulfobacterales bacterium]|nr:HAMP domain-containing protein [Desulfobacterales bacterium]
PTFRYTVPLYVDKACLDCHQNFTRGSIGGCLSFFLPIKQALKSLKGTFTNLALAGIAIILLTGMTLFFLLQKVVIRPVNKIKTMTTEISNGNHQARTHLETGDEFEELGRVFNHMAEQLERNHEIVQEKIETATQELCQANCELKQLDKFKTDFITDMSHELRSPVTAIQGSLDYLKRTTTTNDNKSYLAIIDNNLMRMTHLITDMLDLARIESGKIAWRFEESDMAALIQEVVEILGLKAQERNITLDYDHQGPVWVEMDPERIEQVLVNLMENAIKFSPSGSTILINSSLSDQWIRVVVQDFATGIAEKNLETIFKKFRILPSSGGTGRTKGTGLGLTICRKIIEAHKGRIWAESTVGLGSTFYFILPARPADKA